MSLSSLLLPPKIKTAKTTGADDPTNRRKRTTRLWPCAFIPKYGILTPPGGGGDCRREFGAFKRVAVSSAAAASRCDTAFLFPWDAEPLCRPQVAANTLIVATENSYIIRLDLGGQQAWKEVEISRRPEDSVYDVFLDPTGAHILISFGHGETHYLHSSATKARPLSKLKGLMVSAVAWCAKEVLVGTSEGKIYELVFEGNRLPFPSLPFPSLPFPSPFPLILIQTDGWMDSAR